MVLQINLSFQEYVYAAISQFYTSARLQLQQESHVLDSQPVEWENQINAILEYPLLP